MKKTTTPPPQLPPPLRINGWEYRPVVPPTPPKPQAKQKARAASNRVKRTTQQGEALKWTALFFVVLLLGIWLSRLGWVGDFY